MTLVANGSGRVAQRQRNGWSGSLRRPPVLGFQRAGGDGWHDGVDSRQCAVRQHGGVVL
jgi:hypothetical protein